MDCQLSNPLVNTYLRCVEETESPRIYHAWCLLTMVSAALGRRNYLPFGIGSIFPNLFVVLTGPPAVRKSTAADIASDFLKNNTDVKFAPNDTSGRYQGLIAAMQRMLDKDKLKKEIDREISWVDVENMHINVNVDDANFLHAHAREWGSFLGQNNSSFLTFLLEVFDGKDYEYGLKNEQTVLKDPLMTMLGCSTPTDIGRCIPPEAMGQGFMSRIIFVHADKRYKRVARPKALPQELVNYIGDMFSYIYYQMKGPFQEAEGVEQYLAQLYETDITIDDHRFIYYCNRRYIHMLKTTMCLAAARGSNVIEMADVADANNLLAETEKYMPDALGEYGMSPTAVAKQKLVEMLKYTKEPISQDMLWAMISKDMPRRQDFIDTLADLVNAKKLIRIQLSPNEFGYTSPASVEDVTAIQEALNTKGTL